MKSASLALSLLVGLFALAFNLFNHPAETVPVVVALCVASAVLRAMYTRRQLRLRTIKIKD